MGLTDRIRDLVRQGQDEAATHKDQVHKAVLRAEQAADRQTGGQYHDQIARAGEKADAYVDGLKPSDPSKPAEPPRTAPPRDDGPVTPQR